MPEPPAGAQAHVPRLDVLDGLRGLAIALVLYFHVWQISWLPATLTVFGYDLSWQRIPELGFVGVDLFFFLSGFVIVYPYVRARLEGRTAPTLAHFAYRRFIKIVPSYVLCMAVLIAVGYARFDSWGDAFRQIGLHLLFIHNWWPDSSGSINGVLWSLAIEVQFYAIFPLLVWGFVRAPYVVTLSMAIVAVAWRLIVEQCCSYSYDWLLSQLPAVLDLFAAGMLTAWLFVWLRKHRPKIAGRRALWTLAALGGFVWFYVLIGHGFDIRYEPDGFHHWITRDGLLLALDFGIIGLSSLFALPLWHAALANPALVFLGAISYNLYLWHQVVARYWRDLGWPRPLTERPQDDPHWALVYTLIVIPITIAVATLVTFGFERPLLRWRPPAFTWRPRPATERSG